MQNVLNEWNEYRLRGVWLCSVRNSKRSALIIHYYCWVLWSLGEFRCIGKVFIQLIYSNANRERVRERESGT